MRKRGNYFYSNFHGIRLRFTEEKQYQPLVDILTQLQSSGLPVKSSYVKKIYFDNNFAYPGYFGYQQSKEIHLNPKKIKFYKSIKLRKKTTINYFWLIIHEFVHAWDFDRQITKKFLIEYWNCLEKVRENIGSKLFEYKDRKKVFANALPMYQKLEKFDPYRRYDKRVRKVSGAPNTYSLMAPYEFVAELISFYMMRKNSIPDKSLRRKVQKFVENELKNY